MSDEQLLVQIVGGALLVAASYGLSGDAVQTHNNPGQSTAGVIKVLLCTSGFICGGALVLTGLLCAIIGR